MEIQYTRRVSETITLTEEQVRSITRRKLLELVNPGEYLRTEKDGKIVLKQDDPHWRHGSVSEVYVRDATALDIAIFKVLENL